MKYPIKKDYEPYIYKVQTIGYYLPQEKPDPGIESFKKIRPLLDDLYIMPSLDKCLAKFNLVM